MIIFVISFISLILALSLGANVFLFIAADRQSNISDLYKELYEQHVLKTKERVLNTYLYMKQLDHQEIFSKDDQVGLAFKDMLNILQELNELTQEEGE